jgi:hypothetical protein
LRVWTVDSLNRDDLSVNLVRRLTVEVAGVDLAQLRRDCSGRLGPLGDMLRKGTEILLSPTPADVSTTVMAEVFTNSGQPLTIWLRSTLSCAGHVPLFGTAPALVARPLERWTIMTAPQLGSPATRLRLDLAVEQRVALVESETALTNRCRQAMGHWLSIELQRDTMLYLDATFASAQEPRLIDRASGADVGLSLVASPDVMAACQAPSPPTVPSFTTSSLDTQTSDVPQTRSLPTSSTGVRR